MPFTCHLQPSPSRRRTPSTDSRPRRSRAPWSSSAAAVCRTAFARVSEARRRQERPARRHPHGERERRRSGQTRSLDSWKAHEPASLTLLHTRDRAKADDPDFVKPLTEATGVWIGGGDQSKIAAAYLGTRVETELKNVLARGGVVGGTSAGAAIMSRLMIAGGNPKPNLIEGLGLLPNIIVDQHFSQRKREPRLREALTTHPGWAGIGIDEATAIIVRGRTISVAGENKASVFLAPAQTPPHTRKSWPAGSRRTWSHYRGPLWHVPGPRFRRRSPSRQS